MFKGLGKLKAAAAGKVSKKDKNEDVQTASKQNKNPPKEKEKEKEQKQRKLSKNQKKKKTHGANSIGDISQSSEEPSRSQSQTGVDDASDANRGKAKRQISKACEEAVTEAVSDFFECAWLACAERFFITSAPVTVSYELRNTWLRIVEAEWQDPDMKEREKPSTSSTKNNRIFKKDQPPLPLAFDTWSRGAIEPLPRFRRESVMDPFLRDIDAFGQAPMPLLNPDQVPSVSMASSSVDIDADLSPEAEEMAEAELAAKALEESNKAVPIPEEVKEDGEDPSPGEKWDFELDQATSLNIVPIESESESVEVSYMASESKFPPDSPLSSGGGKLPTLYTLLSARPLSLNESTTEAESSSPNFSDKDKARARSKSANSLVVKKFSPSQCGGRVGSGVFRLLNETTSEALLKRDKMRHDVRSSGVRIEAQNTNEKEDLVLVTKMGETSNWLLQEEDESSEVQPLFEERTPRATESSQGIKTNVWRRPSYYGEDRLKGIRGAPSLEQVASEINKKFLRRRVVNLQGRFKRQALRSLAARYRKSDAMKQRRSTSPASTPEYNSDNASLISSTKMKNKIRYASTYSISVSNVNVVKGNATIGRPVVAKTAASEPLLGSSAVKKENRKKQQKQQQEQRQQQLKEQQEQRQQQKEQKQYVSASNRPGKPKNNLNSNDTKAKAAVSSNSGKSNQNWNNNRDRTKDTGIRDIKSNKNDFNSTTASVTPSRNIFSSKDKNNFSSKDRDNYSSKDKGNFNSKDRDNFSSKDKNNLTSFKTMGNVRATKRSDYRNLVGKFDDSKRTPEQLQTRFETGQKFSRGGNRGWAEQGQLILPATPSDCPSSGTCSPNPSIPDF